MIVTFCGHSQIGDPEKVQKDLEAAIHSVLSRGASRFYLGGYGDFDRLAAKVLYRLKLDRAEIESVLVLPASLQLIISNWQMSDFVQKTKSEIRYIAEDNKFKVRMII